MEFTFKRNFYFEMEGVDVGEHETQTKQHPHTILDCCIGMRHIPKQQHLHCFWQHSSSFGEV
jgi:hypothetical protein